MTEAETVARSRETDAYWQRCAAAGVDPGSEHSWKGMYYSDPERGEEHLAAHQRSYVPPAPVNEDDVARASFGITDASLARAQDLRRNATILDLH